VVPGCRFAHPGYGFGERRWLTSCVGQGGMPPAQCSELRNGVSAGDGGAFARSVRHKE